MVQDTATQPDRKLVLVADDEDDLRWLFADHMSREGHAVVEAADGRLALDVISARDVNVILCDLNRPHAGGRGLYEGLRLVRHDLLDKFILITTGRYQLDTEFFETRTTVPILRKPFPLAVLSEAVAAMVGLPPSGRVMHH